MPTRITEVDTPGGQRTTLRVEGTLGAEDAELVEKICRDLRRETGRRITLDLADLSFIDSDSAHILCRLRAEQEVALEGLPLFIQRVIELAERDEKPRGSVLFRNPREGVFHRP
jgi:anti-anti-sigma regulatory factor